jgi:hypothetical protein
MAELDRSQAMIDQERASSMANQQAIYTSMGNIGSSVVSGSGNIATGMMKQGNTTDTGSGEKSTQSDPYSDYGGEDAYGKMYDKALEIGGQESKTGGL